MRTTLFFLLLVLPGTSLLSQTFAPPLRITAPGGTRQTAPQLRAAPDGTIYLAWTDYRSGVDGELYLATSTDGGASFSTGRSILSAPGLQAGMQRGAQFVIDNEGVMHVVWQQLNDLGKISARYARSTDGGESFSGPVAVGGDEGKQNQDFPSIAVDSSGGVFLAWIDDRDVPATSHTQLFVTRSTDGGLTFETPRRAGTMPGGGGSCECCNTSIAASGDGQVVVSFRSNIDNARDTWIARSLDRGATWSLHQAASESWWINACPMTGSSIALDAAGTAHVVWRDSRPSAGGKDYIYYTTLPRSDEVCLPDRRISSTTRRSNYPSLSLGPRGELLCAFQDNREDANDIYVVTSIDGGATFSPEERLTGSGRQELASALIMPDGRRLIAWQDDSIDEGDVMVARSSGGASEVEGFEAVREMGLW